MNESCTEFEYLDPALKEAGWSVLEDINTPRQLRTYLMGHLKDL